MEIIGALNSIQSKQFESMPILICYNNKIISHYCQNPILVLWTVVIMYNYDWWVMKIIHTQTNVLKIHILLHKSALFAFSHEKSC